MDIGTQGQGGNRGGATSTGGTIEEGKQGTTGSSGSVGKGGDGGNAEDANHAIANGIDLSDSILIINSANGGNIQITTNASNAKNKEAFGIKANNSTIILQDNLTITSKIDNGTNSNDKRGAKFENSTLKFDNTKGYKNFTTDSLVLAGNILK